jgi:hypothetical protein
MARCTWTNWAGSLDASISECEQPDTVEQLKDIVKGSGRKKVRAVGSGHSWSPLVFSGTADDSVLVDMRGIAREDGTKAIRWKQNNDYFVTFYPAATWADVREALTTSTVNIPRMYLPTAGVLPSINATGFVTTGGHGTGWAQPTVADLIHEIDFVDADGKVCVCPSVDLNAARVNLGMLGLITKITLKVEPMFRLRDQEMVEDTADIMGPNPNENHGAVDTAPLRELVTGNDYVELIWFPWSGWIRQGRLGKLSDGEIWLKKWNRTKDPLTPGPREAPNWQNIFDAWIMERVARNTPQYAPLHDLIPRIERTIWNRLRASILRTPADGYVAEAPEVFHYQDFFPPVIVLEVAIPVPVNNGVWDFTNVVNAWYQVINTVRADHDSSRFPLTFCMNARFTNNSQALLSPAYQAAGCNTRYCWFEILSAFPKRVTDRTRQNEMIADFNGLVQKTGKAFIEDMNGRPHWAKYWQTIPLSNLASLFPADNVTTFNDLRRQHDKNGKFRNAFLESLRLFGP